MKPKRPALNVMVSNAAFIALSCAMLSAVLPPGHALAQDMPSTVAKVKPSVVIVGTFKLTNSPRFTLRGTGFVVGDGNWAVTNAHVVPDGADFDPDAKVVVQVRTGQNDLQMRLATVLEVDKLHDLALLQFDGAAVPKLALRDSDTVREGQPVAFMGFPIGGALGFSAVTHRYLQAHQQPALYPAWYRVCGGRWQLGRDQRARGARWCGL
jgi:S1-C subfamily serine protease